MTPLQPGRRPLKSRSSRWAQAIAGRLAATAATPNQISVASVLFAALGAAALLSGGTPARLLAAAACIQLRLLCNLLDGMVAVEGGKQSATGPLYNEIPDRLADSTLIVAAGYAVALPWLGWCSALLALMTAYLRTLGGALGLAQDFRGPMAKPHRMAVLTAGCVLGALEAAVRGSGYALLLAVWCIGIGSLVTCAARTAAIARALPRPPGPRP
jgi:phosphatidylglycerophosphate synthase